MWIEISYLTRHITASSSSPSRGMWIEINPAGHEDCIQRVIPLTGDVD